MRTRTSYAVSKRLKEFLGESAPEPMGNEFVWQWPDTPVVWHMDEGSEYPPKDPSIVSYPAYRLEDLLSRPFCEAFVKVGAKKFGFDEDEITDFVADWSTEMAYAYWNGGLEAVEAALMKMMDKEK